MSKLKILWFNWRCWLNPAMGGAEVFTHEVVKRWVKAGHDVTLFTSQFAGCKKEEVNDGVRIIRAGKRFGVYRQAKQFYKNQFKAEHFDAVIDEVNTRPFFAHKFVDNGERVVALIHQLAREYWFYETPFPINYIGYHFLEDHWLKSYVDISTVTVSESSRQDLLSLGFKNVSVVPEGLNFTPLPEVAGGQVRPVVVYAGRLKRAKRPDHAIKAFKIVKDNVPEAELWIIGDGPFKNALKKNVCAGVKFFGNLPSMERRTLIRQAGVLVNPGVREGWGLNIIEANALGVPCVAYNAPGLRDSVKDGETGFLVESGDINSLANSLIQILTTDALRYRLSVNALNYAKTFSWDTTARQLFVLCENAAR